MTIMHYSLVAVSTNPRPSHFLQLGIIVFAMFVSLLFLDNMDSYGAEGRARFDSSGISIVMTFPGELAQLTPDDMRQNYANIMGAGIKVSNLYYGWGDIENREGQNNWSELDWDIRLIREQGMKISLEISIIDSSTIGKLPQDITFTFFGDTLFKQRFKTFISTLLNRYEGQIDYLWIGNEIDNYFYTHRDKFNEYVNLYMETVNEVKGNHPDVKIGVISSYHDAKNNQVLDIIEAIGSKGDIIAFTFYPQIINGSVPSDTHAYFDEMLEIAGRINKKIAITETSWSSTGFGGSETGQAQYVRELIQTYRDHKHKIEFLGWFIYCDFSDSLNRSIAEHYGLGDNEEYVQWQGSLGLVYNNGSLKESWPVLLEEINKIDELRPKPLSNLRFH